jgi:hypothetical protein
MSKVQKGQKDKKVKRRKDGSLIFDDDRFRPNLTPREIFQQGAFGGTYWRPIQSGVLGRKVEDMHLKPGWSTWWSGIPDKMLTTRWEDRDVEVNKYGVWSGTTLEYWESKGWIVRQDPYGWVQWYCEYFAGRRTSDDARQIDRWLRFAGPTGRFRVRLANMVKAGRKKYNDPTVSPVIRQGLHQWGYELVKSDL